MDRRYVLNLCRAERGFCTAPVLMYYDYEKPLIVSTDASSKAFGAVLSQIDDDEREYPIQYASRNLNEA